MKFRTIFIFFNAVFVFSFVFIFFMPFFLLGSTYMLNFWAENWYLLLTFVAILSVFNVFFGLNWKMFSLLENEKWDELDTLLQHKIFDQKRYKRRYIKLLVNTSLLRSDTKTLDKLEECLRNEKPNLLTKEAVLFGAARLLENNPERNLEFFVEYFGNNDVENAQWLSFYYAFTLVLNNKCDEAFPIFESLLQEKDSVLVLLVAWMLNSISARLGENNQKAISFAKNVRSELKKSINQKKWLVLLEKAKGEVYIVLLSKVLDEASAWLFSDGEEL